ncbi:hypothetical protein ATN83_3178 [Raoultella ornithinolytica]|jgi:hypothetical protein|nr:hypothetical protein ATN83_3178 [Raoultella ornithinolytica]
MVDVIFSLNLPQIGSLNMIRHQAIVLGSLIIFRQLKFPAKPA